MLPDTAWPADNSAGQASIILNIQAGYRAAFS